MTYPEPEKTRACIDPSIYPVDYEEWDRYRRPFYRKPNFYVPAIILVLLLIAVFVIVKPINNGNSVNATPYYDEDKVLTFPEGTTDWRLSPESKTEWPYYLCQINGNWYKCFPVFMSSNSDK